MHCEFCRHYFHGNTQDTPDCPTCGTAFPLPKLRARQFNADGSVSELSPEETLQLVADSLFEGNVDSARALLAAH